MSKVDVFLAHYASEFYDPVKAHEYYLKNRELKEREAAANASLSPETRARQSEAQSYVTNQIRTQRKEGLDKLRAQGKSEQEAHKARMDELRANADEARARIIDKIKSLVDVKPQLANIPQNASPKLRAFLEKQNAGKIQRASKVASAELKKLTTDLRTEITKAREQYTASRAKLAEARTG